MGLTCPTANSFDTSITNQPRGYPGNISAFILFPSTDETGPKLFTVDERIKFIAFEFIKKGRRLGRHVGVIKGANLRTQQAMAMALQARFIANFPMQTRW